MQGCRLFNSPVINGPFFVFTFVVMYYFQFKFHVSSDLLSRFYLVMKYALQFHQFDCKVSSGSLHFQ
jgi:hypothetical protein